MTPGIDTPCIGYERMTHDWSLVSDLWGGTKAMRAAGRRWLPQEVAEEDRAYNVRLNRSTFFNAFKRAVQSLASRPFSKPVTYAPELPDRIKGFIPDCDLNGRHFDVFLRDVFELALRDGMRFVLVDKGIKTEDERTLADQRRLNRRPYVVEIDARNLIYWDSVLEGGKPKLTEIRIRETLVEADGWAQKEVSQIRVLRPGRWEVWRKNAQGIFEVEAAGTTDLPYIPLVAIFTGRKSFMESTPPLLDLAWENVHHWQSRSDQNHILHVARVPVWFGRGISPGDEGRAAGPIRISPNSMITASETHADLKIVEHSGAAVSAGREDLLDCESRMAVLGTELLVNAPQVEKTATQTNVDAGAQYATLSMMVRSLEDSAENILAIMADWEDLTVPAGRYVTIHKEFATAGAHLQAAALLGNARLTGDISRGTFLQELQRLGVLSPQIDVSDEMARTEIEGPTNLEDVKVSTKTQ